MTSTAVKSFFRQWRVMLVLVAMFACVVAIAWKLSALHVLQRDFLQGQGDARTIRTIPLVANRGLITDRNGEPLAVSTPVQSIWVNPGKLADDPASIALLAHQLELNPEVLANSIASNANKEFLYVKRRLAPFEAEAVLNLDIDH
ncbi:MAG: penicillin-binding protein 2, partial [Pseudomonadales bacterium]|nr:penicillin-binding protein 2 [Pseudomonadales bacterium]